MATHRMMLACLVPLTRACHRAAAPSSPSSRTAIFGVLIEDPDRLVRGTKYRVVLDVCEGQGPILNARHVEWRGSIEVAG